PPLIVVLAITTYHLSFLAPATTTTHTLSLHDALPIYLARRSIPRIPAPAGARQPRRARGSDGRGKGHRGGAHPTPPSRSHAVGRSEEHTSELQSRFDLVCRLLLEKKNAYQ